MAGLSFDQPTIPVVGRDRRDAVPGAQLPCRTKAASLSVRWICERGKMLCTLSAFHIVQPSCDCTAGQAQYISGDGNPCVHQGPDTRQRRNAAGALWWRVGQTLVEQVPENLEIPASGAEGR